MEQAGMVTRRRAALARRQLLHLPDELLSMIVMETMWECTLLDRTPDLVSYQRRLTNHPSIQLEKVAFLGGICGRLRGIYKELSTVPTMWTSPKWSWREEWLGVSDGAMSTLLPSSIEPDNLECAILVRSEISYIPLLPARTLAHLVALELYGMGIRLQDGFALSETLSLCTSLKTVRLDQVGFQRAGGEVMRVLEAMPALSQLQHITMHALYDRVYSVDHPRFRKFFEGGSSGHVTRLDVSHTFTVTWSHFVFMMKYWRASLAVARFTTWEASTTQESCELEDLAILPSLGRLTIVFHDGRHPPSSISESTPTGRVQLAVLSPLEIIQKAPSLAYFDCSERLDIKTPAELDEVAKLADREGWKRLRLRLKTWEGEKGGIWTRDEKQDVVVG